MVKPHTKITLPERDLFWYSRQIEKGTITKRERHTAVELDRFLYAIAELDYFDCHDDDAATRVADFMYSFFRTQYFVESGIWQGITANWMQQFSYWFRANEKMEVTFAGKRDGDIISAILLTRQRVFLFDSIPPSETNGIRKGLIDDTLDADHFVSILYVPLKKMIRVEVKEETAGHPYGSIQFKLKTPRLLAETILAPEVRGQALPETLTYEIYNRNERVRTLRRDLFPILEELAKHGQFELILPKSPDRPIGEPDAQESA